MLMAKARHRRAAGGIEDAPAVLADQPDSFTADRDRRCFAQAAMQEAACAGAHVEPPCAKYCEVAASRASASCSRRLAPGPPSENVTAASDCAIAMAPVRLGKNPGEAAASNSRTWSAPSAIGAATESAIAISVAPDRCAACAASTLACE